MNSVELSIVSPVYEAEDIIDQLVFRIVTSISKLTDSYEIILVEDGSTDLSWDKIIENSNKNSRIRGIRLSRNYGQQYALQAGLDASIGEFVATIDCDLQDKPEEINKLLNKAKEGYEIVVASRKNRQDDFLKRFLSRVFYALLGYLTGTKQDRTIANFTLYNRKAIEAMSLFQDHYRYYPMLQQQVGFRYTKVEIEHAPREFGHSSYSIKKRLNLALDTILTFSDKPLRLTVKLGSSITFISIGIAIAMVILYLMSGIKTAGWASLALLLSFFSGSIISVLGVVGLYVGRTFESVKHRPTYIIQEDTKFLKR